MMMNPKNRLIEPAEPEPPPAHSLGKVGEDDMGRSGKLARPCWLGAGGEALVVRNWWRGWWLGLPRLFFFDQVCDQLCTVLSTFLIDFVSKTGPKRAKKTKEIEKTFFCEKSEKRRKKVPKSLKVLFALGVILGPKIHKKCEKSTSKKQAKNDTPKKKFLHAPEQFLFPKRRKLKDFGWILGAKCGLFPSFFWH